MNLYNLYQLFSASSVYKCLFLHTFTNIIKFMTKACYSLFVDVYMYVI